MNELSFIMPSISVNELASIYGYGCMNTSVQICRSVAVGGHGSARHNEPLPATEATSNKDTPNYKY